MQNKKQIALIEFTRSHDECLYTQYLFLRQEGYGVHMILSQEIAARIQGIGNYENVLVVPLKRKGFSDWKLYFQIHKYLKSNHITKAIINTASGKIVRNFLCIPNRDTSFYGVIHNTNKLIRSFSQKMISKKIMKYFVLFEYPLLQKQFRSHIRLQSFYPVFFPESASWDLSKSTDDFWICIPGQIEQKRRDYTGLLQMLKKNSISEDITIVLLGNAFHKYGMGKELLTEIRKLKLEKHFIHFQGFVEQELFVSYLNACDLIMPLIHPVTPEFQSYKNNKISGTFSLSYAFRKPMLLHEGFQDIHELRNISFMYNENDFISVIHSLLENRAELNNKTSLIRNSQILDLKYQSERFVEFIEK